MFRDDVREVVGGLTGYGHFQIDGAWGAVIDQLVALVGRCSRTTARYA